MERIIPYSLSHLLQCNIHHIEKGGASDEPIEHAGEEVGYILSGEIELMAGEQTFRLGQGDAFVFRSELPHHYQNVGGSRASIFLGEYPIDLLIKNHDFACSDHSAYFEYVDEFNDVGVAFLREHALLS